MRVWSVLGLALLHAACSEAETSKQNTPPWGEVAWPELPAVHARVAALGRLLFYDPILGSDGETACATCHSEIWGLSDGLKTSIGVGGGTLTGPGRTGTAVGPRNAQSLWDVAFRERLFWDGREDSLEDQALFPMHSPIELNKSPEAAVADISKIETYVALFEEAFGPPLPGETGPVTVGRLQVALAELQRTFIADRTSYDRWVDGDDGAMTPEMVRGMTVLFESGCTTCHTPPLFSSETFYARHGSDDPGLMAVTRLESDRGRFRTPSLRNIRMTEPYFHDGSVLTLREAIALELERDGVTLSTEDIDHLEAFLGRGLVDRSREPFRPKTVPSGLPVPIDGFRVVRP
ncbi:MAG TPA: cytochrome c peroxidase [Myxococcota bacterium]|nr:cytochrome c peroxidase [Myxococcota bacterium]